MKKIIRIVFSIHFVSLFWPLLLYKRFGNTALTLNGNTVIVANHYSDLDAFLIQLAFRKRKIVFVASLNVKKRPFSRMFAWLFDCVYVGEDSVDLATVRQTVAFLKSGGILAIFPEGCINPRRSGFFDFKNGAAMLAKTAQSTVVPVFIYPEFNLHRRSKLYLGEPIPYTDYAPLKDNTVISMLFQARVMDLSTTMDN